MDLIGKQKTNWIWDICKLTNVVNPVLPLWNANRVDIITRLQTHEKIY